MSNKSRPLGSGRADLRIWSGPAAPAPLARLTLCDRRQGQVSEIREHAIGIVAQAIVLRQRVYAAEQDVMPWFQIKGKCCRLSGYFLNHVVIGPIRPA